MHTNDRPHVCMFCSKGYSEAYQLKQHIKFVHHKERPFQCPQCDKAFSTAIQLRNHMQYHTGKFRYQCPICDKCFITGQSLTKHIRNSRPCREKKPELTKIGNCNKLLLKTSEDIAPIEMNCVPTDCLVLDEPLPILATISNQPDTHIEHLPAIQSIHQSSLISPEVLAQYADDMASSLQHREILQSARDTDFLDMPDNPNWERTFRAQ